MLAVTIMTIQEQQLVARTSSISYSSLESIDDDGRVCFDIISGNHKSFNSKRLHNAYAHVNWC